MASSSRSEPRPASAPRSGWRHLRRGAVPVLGLAAAGSLFGALPAEVLISLTAAQIFVGGYLEPRMMGRAFNLSPFVVLLSLEGNLR